MSSLRLSAIGGVAGLRSALQATMPAARAATTSARAGARPRMSSLELDPQQLRRRLPEHLSAVRVTEARRLQDVIDRLVLPGDRMVGPDDELAHADFRREMPERLSGEDQRVVIHLSQILGRL